MLVRRITHTSLAKWKSPVVTSLNHHHHLHIRRFASSYPKFHIHNTPFMNESQHIFHIIHTDKSPVMSSVNSYHSVSHPTSHKQPCLNKSQPHSCTFHSLSQPHSYSNYGLSHPRSHTQPLLIKPQPHSCTFHSLRQPHSCSYHSLNQPHHSHHSLNHPKSHTQPLLNKPRSIYSSKIPILQSSHSLSQPQSCSYHSLSHPKSHTQPLLNKPHLIYSSNRQLSFAWLDSLAVTQAGWFQGLAKSKLVLTLMNGLQGIHDFTHLPWWASIILSTILLRGVLTFPLAVYQQKIIAKVENLKPEMDGLIKELKRETAIAIRKFNWDQKTAGMMFNKSAKRLWRDLIIRENCHPFKATILLWVQIPLWVSLSMSLRNMASMMPHQDAAAQVLFLQLSTGGFGWIPNLTELDHSLIFPVAMGLTNLIITEINVLSRVKESSRLQNVATNLFRFISVALVPIAAYVPSCVVLYWVTSSMCALSQNLLLMHPAVRQSLGIPSTPSQKQHPYLHLQTQLKKKLMRKKKDEE